MQLRCSLTLMTAATTLSPWICRNTSLGVSSKILWPARPVCFSRTEGEGPPHNNNKKNLRFNSNAPNSCFRFVLSYQQLVILMN